jgi:hypothetical protein
MRARDHAIHDKGTDGPGIELDDNERPAAAASALLINVEFLPPLAEVPQMNFGWRERAEVVAHILTEQRQNSSSIYPFEQDWVRTFAELSYDRAYTQEGVVRQLQAMLTDLAKPFADPARLTMPVVLIDGLDDKTSMSRRPSRSRV